MSVIPKPSGGHRCVGKTPMVYRIWAASRRDDIKKWEVSNMAPWDGSGPKCSALKTSLNRAVNMELARAEGLEAGGILWDFEKLFDNIDPRLLIERAVKLRFPLRDLLMALRMHLAPRWLQMCGMLAEAIYPTTSILAGCGFQFPSHGYSYGKK